jgi:hypothetical protein
MSLESMLAITIGVFIGYAIAHLIIIPYLEKKGWL